MMDSEVSNDRWSKAVFELPPDFLRLTSSNVQESVDREAAMALQQQCFNPPLAINSIGRLSVTLAQAKLVKNYGLTRMDPYSRLRVGHYIYETQTDANGGKTPRWNRVFHTQLPSGVNKIFIEIYDECNFTMDELIAHCPIKNAFLPNPVALIRYTEVKIPDAVLERGETHEDWYPLSGKSGENKEGMIDLVLSFTSAASLAAARPIQQPVMFVPNVSGRALPVYVQPQPQQVLTQQPAPQPIQPLTDEDIANLMEMFPSVDKDVIRSIGESNRGQKEATINCLLQLTN